MPLRYAAGIINYRTYAALDRCLAALEAQSVRPVVTAVIDHDPDFEVLEAMQRARSEVVFDPRPNAGFAAGANRVIRLCTSLARDAAFVLLLNPDVEPEPPFAENLLKEMASRPRVALASGKLLRPDGRIDSAGITMPRNRRPRDRGSEQIDRGQFDSTECVFGVSGAALMIRRGAVGSLAVGGEIFDEDFFVYHEDTDLAWRARLLGWSSLYVPQARALHRRGWRRGAWRRMSSDVRRHSFKNHYLEMIKNEKPRDFVRDLPLILLWEVLRFGHALIRDRSRIPAYASAYRLAGRAWSKRQLIHQRIGR